MSDWYLFDPEDPARAEQVMQQLRSDGTTLVVERGTFAGWEIVESQSMATPLAVQWAIEGRLAEARERGLASESDPYVVIDRLSARHPELEAAIEAIDVLYSTQGHAALAVYADFLQAKGDPRGTLAMLQLRDPYDRAALEWLADHRVQLFGPLAASTSSDLPKFRWTGGFITGVAGATDVPLATVLRLPACASLRSLQGTWRTVRDGCRTAAPPSDAWCSTSWRGRASSSVSYRSSTSWSCVWMAAPRVRSASPRCACPSCSWMCLPRI